MKKKKKWREIRSAVTMMLVMVAMLSTATYAWFSLTSNPVVNGLQMTAASTGGLKISETIANPQWYNAIDLNDDVNPASNNTANMQEGVFKLMEPATLIAKDVYMELNFGQDDDRIVPQFATPEYNATNSFLVDGAHNITNSEVALFNSHIAMTTYYLKNETGAAASVGIVTADGAGKTATDLGVTTDNNPKTNGSFVVTLVPGDETDSDNMASDAIRVAFVITPDGSNVSDQNSTMFVWEPNGDRTRQSGSTYATNGLQTVAAPDVRSHSNGTLYTGNGLTTVGTEYTTDVLFSIAKDGIVRVDMYVWFEGQDNECVDQIMKDLIEVQVQFAVVG